MDYMNKRSTSAVQSLRIRFYPVGLTLEGLPHAQSHRYLIHSPAAR